MLNSLKLWGLLISCLVLATATASGQTGPQPPPSSPAQSFLTVPVIGQVVGQPVARITASTAVVLRSTGSRGTLTWITVPEAAAEHLTKIQTDTGEQGVTFSWPGHPEVVVILIATDGVTTTTEQFTIPADGVPVPPFVDPEPGPQPDPPIPVNPIVVIVSESFQPDHPTTLLLAKLTLHLTETKQPYHSYDPNQKEASETPAPMAAVLSAAKAEGIKGPVLAVVVKAKDGSYSVVSVKAMPAGWDGAVNYLRQHGVEIE